MPFYGPMSFRVIKTFTLADARLDRDPTRDTEDRRPEGPAPRAVARVFRLHGPAARLELPPGPVRPDARLERGRRRERQVR
jgi:hypothetical protein